MELLTDTIVPSVVSFILGSGGIIAYLKFFQEKRKETASFDETELKKYKEQYADLQERVTQLEVALIPSLVPEWRKDSKGIYQYVSGSYEVSILLPLGLTRQDVIGKTDLEAFSAYPSFAEVLTTIDREVRLSQRRFTVKKNVVFPNTTGEMMVIKEVVQDIKGITYFVGRAYIQDGHEEC